MSKINKELTFQVHPSVIFKLGEDLITDDYQALSELAKNCYDADASRSQISIFTNKWYCLQDGVPMEVENQETGNIRGMIEMASVWRKKTLSADGSQYRLARSAK